MFSIVIMASTDLTKVFFILVLSKCIPNIHSFLKEQIYCHILVLRYCLAVKKKGSRFFTVYCSRTVHCMKMYHTVNINLPCSIEDVAVDFHQSLDNLTEQVGRVIVIMF